MVNLIINGEKIQVKDYTTVLDACKALNINVPTLCHLDLHEINYYNNPASCRVCVVEDLNTGKLVTSCATPVYEGMEISTDSIKAINARRSNVELLLSNHPNSCLTCARNTNCELQKLAHDLGVREIEYEGEMSQHEIDTTSHALVRDANKCILCRRCETMCSMVQKVNALSIQQRGFDTFVGSAFDMPMLETTCTFCGQCLAVCPTGALTEVDNTRKVWRALASGKHVIAQTAPAVRVALGEEFGYEPGTNVTGKMVTAIRNLGFSGVFDTNFAADLTIMEEGAEVVERLMNDGPYPIITSCCPAWVNFMESQFSDMIHLPSTAKSPHEMFGAVAKTYYAKIMGLDPKDIYVVSIMPCVAKKHESMRPELGQAGEFSDVDTVITTRELARMIKEAGINFNKLEASDFDSPMGESTGGADIFGTTGGVIEAAIRSVHKQLTGDDLTVVEFSELKGFKGIKKASIDINGKTVNIAVTNGLGNIRTLLEGIRSGEIDNLHAVEVMACPGGCIGGAGQPYHHGDMSVLTKRAEGIYAIDRGKEHRISSDNKSIQKLYEDFFGEVAGELAHKYLHTSYMARERY